MKNDVLAPSVGESITEVSILSWTKKSGEAVKTGEVILEIESDKATVEVIAESDGALEILKDAGETVSVGEVIGKIDTAAKGVAASSASTAPPAQPEPAMVASADGNVAMSPSVRKAVLENQLNPNEIQGTGKRGRITNEDVNRHLSAPAPAARQPAAPAPSTAPISDTLSSDRPGERRVPMSRLRKRIAERLVEAQQNAAILTTFNEVNMSAAMALRKQHNPSVIEKHGIKIGFMSIFTRACVKALQEIPAVNAFLDGTEIVYHDYVDMGIAVGTDRGLVVPVIRNADQLSFVEIEKNLAALAEKARAGRLSIADMSGGTFTISNGGSYGSMMSTPILNPPQTGILGMHNIVERPIAINGKVEIHPMMYLALSYDHRLIDGKEAVTFLVRVKHFVENPDELGLDY